MSNKQQRAICVAIQEKSTRETLDRLRSIQERANLVEIRADGIEDLDAAAILQDCRRPCIWTCRAEWEGGRFKGSERERWDVLERGARLGASYVDVEFRADFATEARRRLAPARVILSRHLFEEGLPDLGRLFEKLSAVAADIYKVAVTPAGTEELLRLLDEMPQLLVPKNRILIGMGQHAQPARLLGALWGNCWIYASADAGRETGPGQLSLGELDDDYRLAEVPDNFFLCALVGDPVSHSLSPRLHNYWFREKGIAGFYVAIQAGRFEPIVSRARKWPLRGLSVTVPHKIAAFKACAKVDPCAGRAGAVNTLVRQESEWWGFNSDIEGFLHPLKARVSCLKGRNVALVGAGGAARAVLAALADEGCHIEIFNRSVSKGLDLAREFGARAAPLESLRSKSAAILVNASSVGMQGESLPVALRPKQFELVYDLVYNRRPTPLLRQARELGMVTIGGEEMFVGQAARQFELWTGVPLSADDRRDGFERLFGSV